MDAGGEAHTHKALPASCALASWWVSYDFVWTGWKIHPTNTQIFPDRLFWVSPRFLCVSVSTVEQDIFNTLLVVI